MHLTTFDYVNEVGGMMKLEVRMCRLKKGFKDVTVDKVNEVVIDYGGIEGLRDAFLNTAVNKGQQSSTEFWICSCSLSHFIWRCCAFYPQLQN